MSIRKQTIWNPQKDSYSGFVDFGNEIPNEHPENLRTEAFGFSSSRHQKSLEMSSGIFLD